MNVATISLDQTDVSLEYITQNIMSNTQPNHPLRYPCLFQNYVNSSNWMKILFVEGGFKTLFFDKGYINCFKNKKRIKIANGYTHRVKLWMPDLIFIVSMENLFEKCKLSVYAINGEFGSKDCKFSSVPLPNIYNDNTVCQTSKIAVSKNFKEGTDNKILNDSFDICEYYVDLFMTSIFNKDLDSRWCDVLQNVYGYNSIKDFIMEASDKKNKYIMQNVYAKANKYMNIYNIISNINNNDINLITEFGYDNSLAEYNKVYEFYFDDKIFKKGYTYLYKNRKIKILSFGYSLFDKKKYNTDSIFNQGDYIVCVDTESYEIDKIYLSDSFLSLMSLEIKNIAQICNIEISDIFVTKSIGLNRNTYYRISNVLFDVNNDIYIVTDLNDDTHYLNPENIHKILNSNVYDDSCVIPIKYFKEKINEIDFSIYTKFLIVDEKSKQNKIYNMYEINKEKIADLVDEADVFIVSDDNGYFCTEKFDLVNNKYITNIRYTHYGIMLLENRVLNIDYVSAEYKKNYTYDRISNFYIEDDVLLLNDQFRSHNNDTLLKKIDNWNKCRQMDAYLMNYPGIYSTLIPMVFDLDKVYRLPINDQMLFMEQYKAIEFVYDKDNIFILFEAVGNESVKLYVPLYIIYGLFIRDRLFISSDITPDEKYIHDDCVDDDTFDLLRIYYEGLNDVYLSYEIVDICRNNIYNLIMLKNGLIIQLEKNDQLYAKPKHELVEISLFPQLNDVSIINGIKNRLDGDDSISIVNI